MTDAPRDNPDRDHRQRDAWAAWLPGYRWTHWVTATWRHPVHHGQARWAVGKWLPPEVTAAVVAYPTGRAGGRLHVHALLDLVGPPRVVSTWLRARWRWGNVHVQRYDPRRGAAYYMLEDLTAVDLIGVPRPRRRRHGPRRALSPSRGP